jgi:hypothetical protein
MRLTEESQMGLAAIGERCAAAAVAWRWSLGFDSSRRILPNHSTVRSGRRRRRSSSRRRL